MGGFSLYLRYSAASIRAQMLYPGAFLMVALAQFLVTFIEYLGVWALFDRFQGLRGWTIGEVAVFYGLVNIAFALADTVARGFEVLGPEFIRTGNFDRLLLRPRAAALQVVGHELRLSRLGRLAQGVLVFALGAALADIDWSLTTVLLLTGSVLGGVALFFGILVLQATLSFWTVESLEVANIFSDGGVQAAQFPLDIYAGWFRALLIYGVPIACVAYFPVVAALGRTDPLGTPAWFGWVSPAMGLVFLAVSLQVWRLGVARYTSTGS